MKLIHTADWHLGKLVQGVYMTEDQRFALKQLLAAIEEEKPDAVIIAGDLYDRAVPPTEAVELLDELLERIVIGLGTPVLAVSGNHDSPDRLDFGTAMMKAQGLHIAGKLKKTPEPVVLHDRFGEVHFHLVPYADPAQARQAYGDDAIRTHDDAMRETTQRITRQMDTKARHVLIGHAFVTPTGAAEPNTSDSERPLSIGGAEHVTADYFTPFHYTALGHLHQAHFVARENIRYAGSPLKYSISEERHNKGFLIVELAEDGMVTVEKRELKPLRDMRRVVGMLEDIEKQAPSEDYVFVTLLDENPVMFPMEKVRAVYPNALHVERKPVRTISSGETATVEAAGRREADPTALFGAFYEEVKGMPLGEEQRKLFEETLEQLLKEEGGVA
ncbi:exonuclease SbcCD subunit D [Paenibacillus sp. NPDC058071]|uniref:exonuclease SbcCD subunit D n=1 Tax=Paenibacillus sp. NPDC058071 TaxID=3346326 RepID=UPI0036DA3167